MTSMRGLFVLGLLSAVFLMSGCGGGYVIRGKAVRGELSSMSFVDPSDRRFEDAGVANVKIYVFRDPDSLGRELITTGTTDLDGNFTIPISTFGAGWLIEQWLIDTYRPGYESAQSVLTLPKQKMGLKLLINLNEGMAIRPPLLGGPMSDYEKFK